jgi:hypothetical protein
MRFSSYEARTIRQSAYVVNIAPRTHFRGARKSSIKKALSGYFMVVRILTALLPVLYSSCSSWKEPRTPTRWDSGYIYWIRVLQV